MSRSTPTIGRLRRRLRIEQRPRERERDPMNDPTDEWDPTPVAVRWAEVIALQGRELELARQVVADVTHRITIRWLPGIDPAMRIVFDEKDTLYENGRPTFGPAKERAFGILACLDPDDRRRWLVVYAKEKTA